MNRRITAALILFVVTAVLGVFLFKLSPPNFRSESGKFDFRKPKEALDFVLPEVLHGKPLSFFDWAEEKPVLLVFWAVWCPPCVAEIPELRSLEAKALATGRFKVLAVHVGSSEESLEDFLKRQNIPYTVVWDKESKVASDYGVVGLPVAVMLDPKGKILYYGFSLPDPEEVLEGAGRGGR